MIRNIFLFLVIHTFTFSTKEYIYIYIWKVSRVKRFAPNMHFKVDIREKSIVAKGLLATYGKKTLYQNLNAYQRTTARKTARRE